MEVLMIFGGFAKEEVSSHELAGFRHSTEGQVPAVHGFLDRSWISNLGYDLLLGKGLSTSRERGWMSFRQETELKVRLGSREEYERLCRAMQGPGEGWDQTNHYFQSVDGKIPGEDGVIRIRLERGRALFTVKLGSLRDGLARAEEYEEPWSGSWEDMPPPSSLLWESGHAGMKVLEQKYGRRFPLVWVGKMVNRRKLYRSAGGLCLEVDASLYPDGYEDYEVEVETESPESDRERLKVLLEELGIRFSPQTATKYQRFLMHVGRP